jgi:hypothetical protein
MKFTSLSLFAATVATCFKNKAVLAQPSGMNSLVVSDKVAMEIEYVGSVPITNDAPSSYNMRVNENFDDGVFFTDQAEGIIYWYPMGRKDDGPAIEVWNKQTGVLPEGMDLSYSFEGAGQRQYVHAMAPGSKKDEVYVVFTSSTLPEGIPYAGLPAPFPGNICTTNESVPDLYRLGTVPDCFDFGNGNAGRTVYKVFTRMSFHDGVLDDPVPFFAVENQLTLGHLGGAILTLDDGRFLWGVGDCLPYGTDGRDAPQDPFESCGKILLIDPEDQSYDVVAMGVRNAQQINYFEGSTDLYFPDIGGVTAEEVNTVDLCDLLDTTVIENFGWGRNMDGHAREGTFYVQPGRPGAFGADPPFDSDAPVPEVGFIQPYTQFGRSASQFFYAISSTVASASSFCTLEIVWSEFNSGLVLATDQDYDPDNGPAEGFVVRLFDAENGDELLNGFNDLVPDAPGRGDARLFRYPDGTAGVFIERTGSFYRLTETVLKDGASVGKKGGKCSKKRARALKRGKKNKGINACPKTKGSK